MKEIDEDFIEFIRLSNELSNKIIEYKKEVLREAIKEFDSNFIKDVFENKKED